MGISAWNDALALLEDDLRRRDAASRTRRAYGTDLALFARWLPANSGLRQPAETALGLFQHLNDPLGEYAYCFCAPSPAGRSR